jgi:hypothetical protein
MAKYISIPISTASISSVTFNAEILNTVAYLTTTTFGIYNHGKLYTFTTSAAGAAGAVVAINNAILNPSGPKLIQVVLPSGVTIANPPVVS